MKKIDSIFNIDPSDIGRLMFDAFEQSYTPIVITEAELEPPGPKFIYANQAFCSMSGYTLDELKDKTPRILQGEKTDKVLLAHLKETIKKGEIFRGSTVNYKKDGSEYVVEWNISPIRDQKRTIIYYISMQRDITIEVELEKEREKSFRQQAKMASLSEVIEMALHQWKQPLSVINMLSTELYNSVEEGEMSLEKATMINNGIEKQIDFMVKTLKNFRDFAMSEGSGGEFALKEAIESLVMLFARALSVENIDINLDFPPQAIYLKGRQNEFQQVILNLITNSIYAINKRREKLNDKYLQGNIELRIEQEGGVCIILYSDNGGGIESAVIDRIFDKHFTTKGGEGSGIGLAVSKKIIQDLGGTIEVRNIEEGVSFIVKLDSFEVR